MNFQTILMPKVDLAKILSEKAGLSEPLVTFKYALKPFS